MHLVERRLDPSAGPVRILVAPGLDHRQYPYYCTATVKESPRSLGGRDRGGDVEGLVASAIDIVVASDLPIAIHPTAPRGLQCSRDVDGDKRAV
jgi:hypothetical protein